MPCCDVPSHDLSRGTTQTKVQDLDLTILTHTNIAGFQILGTREWYFGIMGTRDLCFVLTHSVYDPGRMNVLWGVRQ